MFLQHESEKFPSSEVLSKVNECLMNEISSIKHKVNGAMSKVLLRSEIK